MSYWTGKRVVVTGGAGFLGSHVVAELEARKCAEVYVSRSNNYDLTTEKGAEALFADHPADIVFHLAGLVGGIGANKAHPADYFYQNLMMGTLTVHGAWKSGAQKVIAAGAGCGYPEDAPMPQKESSFWNGFPQEDSAPYSLAKRMLHVQAMAYWKQHGFPVVICIPGNIYGPYDNFDLEAAHVIPALVRKFVEATDDGHETVEVWGSGRPSRDFVYGGDVAAGMLLAAEVYDGPQLVNLSSGQETTIREVIELLRKITGYSGEIRWDDSRPDGQVRRVFDLSKARDELSFEANTSLSEGLEKTIDWYRANRGTARNVAAL
jgi:GDP-L-fucose synthase